MAELRMAAAAGHEMRGIEAIDVVAVPDNLRRHAAAFRERHQTLKRILHHLLAGIERAQRVI